MASPYSFVLCVPSEWNAAVAPGALRTIPPSHPWPELLCQVLSLARRQRIRHGAGILERLSW